MRHKHIISSLALLSLLGVVLLAGSWAGRSGLAPAAAQRGGDHFDVRDLIGPDGEEEPTDAQLEALGDLQGQVGVNVRADFNRLSGAPRSVFARGLFLSPPAAGSPGQIAYRFIADNSELFALTPALLSGLKESQSYVNESSGIAHVEYRQEHGGLPVFQSRLRVAVTDDGRVQNVTGDYHPALPNLGSQPQLSEAQALDAAFAHAGFSPAESLPGPATPGSGLSDALAPSAELVVFPLGGGEATLGWRALIPRAIDYREIVVDADDGALLYSSNLTADSGPEGQVFAEHPDASTLTTEPFVGPLPPPRDSWIGSTSLAVCTFCTNGNNVAAIADRSGDLNGPLASSPQKHFNFGFADSWALAGDPDADEETSITNLFYLVNVAHDYFYGLGFTEAAGNFQDDNFGAGGVGEDPVVATTYVGYDSCPYLPQFDCFNNAFFSTPPDGSIPLLSSFLFTSPNRDPSLDGDVMLHEYAHGVSTRIVGVGALSGIQSGAMGEGWSDYFAISFFDDPVVGEYSTQDPVRGIRDFAYDSSPLTYGDLCAITCEEHADGEIWAAALWDLRQFYVGDLGLAAGRVVADELIVEGLMLTPPLPSMLEARDAILQAELASGGAHQADLWQVFAGRGMGCSAFSIGDTGTVAEAFDIPVGGVCDGAACDSPASPLAIPDISFPGVSDTIVLSEAGVIADLRVCLRIDHTQVGDLSAWLTHVETGTTVALLDRPGVPASASGCVGSDIVAILDDAAATPIEDECTVFQPTIEGAFRPAETLSAFDWQEIAGSWRLTVSDTSFTETGSLIGWSLIPALTDPTPTPTPAPTPTPTPSPTPTPTPTPGPDGDGDGVEDALDNCPLSYNPSQVSPPWTVPAGDADCDGYLPGDATSGEVFIGTDPADACADTVTPNDERGPAFGEPLSPWPPDVNDDGTMSLSDVLNFAPAFLSIKPDPAYDPRFDLNADERVTLSDVLSVAPYFLKDCADYFAPLP